MTLVIKDTRHNYEGRVEKLKRKISEQNLDGVYITAGPNMFYFSGFNGYGSGWPIWLTGLIIPKKGEAIAILNNMHKDIAAYADTWVKDFRTYEDGDNVIPILRRAMEDSGLARGRVGIEANLWSAERDLIANATPAVELVNIQEMIDDLRMVKDELELSLLRKACEAGVAGFKACQETARVGTPGRDVAVAVFNAMTANGSLANPMGVFRHFFERDLREGDIICCDLQGQYKNYMSDAARTIFVGGISDDLNQVYDILLDTREQLYAMLRPGVRVEDIHREACRLVARTGYPQPWRIGHGIGLAPVHEQPLLQYGSKVVLQPGMVFTIDAGVHFPHPDRDLPIAIEDTILVTEDGYEVLSSYPSKIITD